MSRDQTMRRITNSDTIKSAIFAIWKAGNEFSSSVFSLPTDKFQSFKPSDVKGGLYQRPYNAEIDENIVVTPHFKGFVLVERGANNRPRATFSYSSLENSEGRCFVVNNDGARGIFKALPENTTLYPLFKTYVNLRILDLSDSDLSFFYESILPVSSIPYWYVVNSKEMFLSLKDYDLSDMNDLLRVSIQNGEVKTAALISGGAITPLMTYAEKEALVSNRSLSPVMQSKIEFSKKSSFFVGSVINTAFDNCGFSSRKTFPESFIEDEKRSAVIISSLEKIVKNLQKIIDGSLSEIMLETANNILPTRRIIERTLPKQFDDADEATRFLHKCYHEEKLSPEDGLHIRFYDEDMSALMNTAYAWREWAVNQKGIPDPFTFMTKAGNPILKLPFRCDNEVVNRYLFLAIKKYVAFSKTPYKIAIDY